MSACLLALLPSPDSFPRSLTDYPTVNGGFVDIILARAKAEPFNVAATFIFFSAIIHTFLAPKFIQLAHAVEAKHSANGPRKFYTDTGEEIPEVSFAGQILHFLGEVEVVFALWGILLMGVITLSKGWGTAVNYIGNQVNYTEPLFVMVIMALASSRPIMRLAENSMSLLSSIGGQTIAASWLTILIIGPLLGSFITEPGAMTICALLLARQFYHYGPSSGLAYATIGLLFVNVSVGGTLTHFGAPPMIMVAGPWKWDVAYMFSNFGWRAATGITVSTLLYYIYFRKEFFELEAKRMVKDRFLTQGGGAYIPTWIIIVQVLFISYTVLVSHYPPLFIGGFLVFMAFSQATAHYQKRIDLRPPLLVALFLAALEVHGGLQSWWLQPLIGDMGRLKLFWGATFLTSFNDNAAITYLATLVPNLSEGLKHAVVAGAVTGGGLTVIANAPNPAGQSILQRFFPDGVSAIKLAIAALIPTLIMAAAFLF